MLGYTENVVYNTNDHETIRLVALPKNHLFPLCSVMLLYFLD